MAKYYDNNTFIYHNGHLVKAADAKIDLYSQTMHYGYGVFEGIRAYKTIHNHTQIFKAEEHFERLKASAEALHLPFHWSVPQLIAASYQVLKRNDLEDAYIRPLIYAPANMSFVENEVSYITIQAWPMQPFLGDKLLQVLISDFQRPNPKAFPIHAKACGHYVNSILASQDAKRKGFDEALLLDAVGNIAEAPGANIFVEKDGRLYTPKSGQILKGITRATVFELAAQNGISIEEKDISVNELYQADSAFFCGTAAEIIGIQKINDTQFSVNWNETLGAKLQQQYKTLVRNEALQSARQEFAA